MLRLLRQLFLKQTAEKFLTISPHKAYQDAKAECLCLIDIRQPQECKATGRPQLSNVISLHEPEFVSKVNELVKADKSVAIAIICQTGIRSKQAFKKLSQEGFENIALVEGSFPAWQKIGLPVTQFE